MFLKYFKKVRLNLTTKFVVLFLTISLVPLIIAVYISYDSSRKVLEEKAAYQLYQISDNKVYQIDKYFSEAKKAVAVLARMPSTISSMEKFNQAFQEHQTNSLEYLVIDKELRAILLYFQEASKYDDLFFISPEGNLTFSTVQKHASGINYLTDLKANPDLTAILKSTIALLETKISTFKLIKGDKIRAYITSPVSNEGKFIGVIGVQINNEGIYDVIKDYTGLGKTGEIVLVARLEDQITLVAPSRHDPEGAFETSVELGSNHGIALQKAVQREKSWGITTDYKGEKVLATWRYLPNYQWGLVVKMNADEILKTANELKDRLAVVGTILLIMIILITVLMARSVSGPIKKLTKVAATISKGNLLARARINTKDEIEELANSFNQMTDNLLKTQSRLKEKSEQLAINLGQIEIQNKELEQEKNKVSQEKDKLNAILYGIGDGVFVVDPDYKIMIFNQEAEIISGITYKEATGKRYDHVLNFISEKNGKSNGKFIREAINSGEIRETSFDTVLVKKDNEKIPVAGSAAPLKDSDGNVISCVVVFRDVSKEREIDQAKTEFVSLASHQLRTPLSTVSWYAEMLLDEDVGKINKDQKKYLQALYDANHRMVELVNALLNVSRIELGTFAIDPEPIKFLEIADSVIKEQTQQIKEKGLKIEKNYAIDLPIINADPRLLRIILQNLISNAVKYTPEKGSITIEISKKDSDILVKVKDTGYGIPKSQQSKIFNKLFRADNVLNKDCDGTGLGLYIVKSVVEQSGGKIWFESEENEGTTFFTTIPLIGMKKKKGVKVLAS
ncbi:PAS domain-containing protein [Patescibacteria group bacterium]|nr:PAS domain-containing protein [Patescibacteria group bacterium]